MERIKYFVEYLNEQEEMGVWITDKESAIILKGMNKVDFTHPVCSITDNYTHVLGYKLKNSTEFETMFLTSTDGSLKLVPVIMPDNPKRCSGKDGVDMHILITTGTFNVEWFTLT